MSTGDPRQTIRRFSWRTIPVALLLGFGGMMVLGGLLLFLLMAYTAWTGSPLYEPAPPPGFSVQGLTIAAWNLIAGACFLFAGSECWKARRMRALGIVVALIAITYLAGALGILPQQ